MSGQAVAGVDVGGTFTDVFVLDEKEGRVSVAKVSSTKRDQSEGFADGIEAAAGGIGNTETIVHGTTVATNALLERGGARTGMITTRGFRDVLEMRRRDRPATWGLWGRFEPVIERRLRLEVAERTLADGTVRTPVDPGEVRAAAKSLLGEGCEAVCVFFVNSYANPANERAAAAAVREAWPNAYVTAATDILLEIREFERCSTAALNAYLQPVVSGYLERLEGRVARAQPAPTVLIVQSNGGVMSIEAAKSLPVRTALSGPAAGVVAARAIAAAAGHANVITGDMGGTSFDVSLVADGESATTAQASIDFGMVVRTPMVEMTTIGAGGGSIAHLGALGLPEIGPMSAGADPGPACYGLGNDRPTVTDANVVLGRIDAGNPIGGGRGRLDADAALKAIGRHIAQPLGLGAHEAAEAVVRVANAKMSGAIRLVTIERGHDPKRFALMPFGGSGALHAGALMRDLGLAASLVPRYPGVNSALGCVMSDLRHDEVRTLNRPLDSLDFGELAGAVKLLSDQGAERIRGVRARVKRIRSVVELDMLYAGQTHYVSVPVDASAGLDRDKVSRAFEGAYARAYGSLLEGIPVRVFNLRVSTVGVRPEVDLRALAAGRREASAERCLVADTKIYADGAWHDAGIYRRLDLPEGERLSGPALLVQSDATIYVDPGLEASVDGFGNVVMRQAEDG